jgi:hypothetical protein
MPMEGGGGVMELEYSITAEDQKAALPLRRMRPLGPVGRVTVPFRVGVFIGVYLGGLVLALVGSVTLALAGDGVGCLVVAMLPGLLLWMSLSASWRSRRKELKRIRTEGPTAVRLEVDEREIDIGMLECRFRINWRQVRVYESAASFTLSFLGKTLELPKRVLTGPQAQEWRGLAGRPASAIPESDPVIEAPDPPPPQPGSDTLDYTRGSGTADAKLSAGAIGAKAAPKDAYPFWTVVAVVVAVVTLFALYFLFWM